MKTLHRRSWRSAIAMIELIFAIVIIGIVLLSVPNITSVATDSGYVSMQQEAIASAATDISLIMTKHWDENNVPNGTTITSTAILRVTNGTPTLTDRNGTKTRTFTLSSGGEANATAIGADANENFDDIDDADGTTMTLRNFADTSIEAGDIVDTNITIATTVNYIDDGTSGANEYDNANTIQYNFSPTAVAATTNIKAITIRLTTNNPADELAKDIRLQAFSANIGSYEPARRDIP